MSLETKGTALAGLTPASAQRTITCFSSAHCTFARVGAVNWGRDLHKPTNGVCLSQVLITIYWLGRRAHGERLYHGPYLNFKAFEGLLGTALYKVRKKSLVTPVKFWSVFTVWFQSSLTASALSRPRHVAGKCLREGASDH